MSTFLTIFGLVMMTLTSKSHQCIFVAKHTKIVNLVKFSKTVE